MHCNVAVAQLLPSPEHGVRSEGSLFSRSACRVVLRCVGPKTTTVSLWLETAILVYLMTYAWYSLYLNLFSVDECQISTWWCNVSFDIAVTLATIMLCDSIVFYVLGAAVYGRLYARRLTFLAALVLNICILCSLFASHLSFEVCLYSVPFACSYRLLINYAYNYKRKAWNERNPLQQRNVGLAEVLAAIDVMPHVSSLERTELKAAARDVDLFGHQASMPPVQPATSRVWNSNDMHRFIRTAEVSLTNSAYGLEKLAEVHRVDRLLIRLMNSVGGIAARPRNYDLLETMCSCLRHLWRGRPTQLLLFCVLSLLDAILVSVVQTWLVSRIVTAATLGDRVNARFQLLAYLGSYVLDAVTYVIQSYTSSICLAAAVAHLQQRVAAGMLSMGAQEHSLYPNGSVQATFSSDIARVDGLCQVFCWAMLNPMMRVAVAVIFTLYMKAQVGVLALTFFPLIFSTIPQERSSSAAAAVAKKNVATTAMFVNGLSCQRMIWMCDHQRQWLHRYLGPLILQLRNASFGSRYMAGLVQAYAAQLVTIFVGTNIAIFAWLAVEGVMTVPDFTAMMSLFLNLSSPIRTLAGFFRTAVVNAGSAQRVDDFIHATSRAVASTKADLVNLEAPVREVSQDSMFGMDSFHAQESGGLTMQNISFAYPNAATEVLKCISLHIKAGEFLAIVGESGCGKSTLLSLMMTWLQPTKGCMGLNDSVMVEVLADVNTQKSTFHITKQTRRLRDQIAVVFQDTMLLNGTVHDNIAFGAPLATRRSDVEWAADAAGITDFISSLPHGLDTQLGGAGDVSLSGGQAQRVCIARALCRKPKLLLLDEATSALDPETESHILQTISSMRSTHPAEFASLVVVSVTHRPDTLKYADAVLRMAAGVIQSIERPASQFPEMSNKPRDERVSEMSNKPGDERALLRDPPTDRSLGA